MCRIAICLKMFFSQTWRTLPPAPCRFHQMILSCSRQNNCSIIILSSLNPQTIIAAIPICNQCWAWHKRGKICNTWKKFWVEYHHSKADNNVEVECSWCPVLSLKGPVGAGNLRSPAQNTTAAWSIFSPRAAEQRGPDTVTCHHHHTRARNDPSLRFHIHGEGPHTTLEYSQTSSVTANLRN